MLDLVEINDSTFASVFQFCNGPDLSTYQKIHKLLSEKEAKIISRSILEGLMYLNSHK